MTGDSSISNGVEKSQADQGAADQKAGDQNAASHGAVENGQANQEIVDRGSIISRFNPKLFYRSDFYDEKADEEIFKQIEAQNEELCKEFSENRFTFSVKNMKSKKIPEFIEKFRASPFFQLCFQIKGRTKGSGKAAKTVFEQRVGPDYLQEIDAICIMLDDRHIYRFEGDDQIKALRKALARHGFEFERERVVGICFDAKHAYKILKCCFEFDEATLRKIIWHDPKMAHWSLDPDVEEPASLMTITAEYLQLDDVEAFLANANEVMKTDPLKYTTLFRTVLLMPIMVEQRKELKKRDLFDSYMNVELPALLLFGQMELTGFPFDVLLSRKSKKDWDGLISQLYKLVQERNDNKPVNVRSPQQVKAMLEELGLYDQYVEHFPLAEGEVKENLKTGKEILERMLTFDKLPGYILDIRKLYHTIGVVENMEKMCSQTNSVMGLYKHFISTGRVAMHDPNLLGIDNDQTIEINGEEHRVSLKRMFVAKAGFTLVAADYSQIELRILAVLADEAGLKEIFSQDQDPFKQIASRIKNKPVDEVTAEERSWSKQILYSIIYGAGVHRLSANLGQSEEKTKEFLAEFHGVFKNITPFIKRCIREAQQTGYAETLFGRKRILEAINDEDDASRLSDERKCVNTRIQGTAADLVKLAMLKVNRAVAQEGIECDALLQVHDELIFQVRDTAESVRKFVRLLVREMTGFGDHLGTKFAVKVKKGANWADLNEVDLNSL